MVSLEVNGCTICMTVKMGKTCFAPKVVDLCNMQTGFSLFIRIVYVYIIHMKELDTVHV